MSVNDHDGTADVTPIHQAIDQVTILMMELNLLRQAVEHGEAIDPARLDIMDTALDQLTTILTAYRDQVDSAP